MQVNRFARIFDEQDARPTARSLAGFAVCPVVLIQVPWQVQIYQAAYEQARAAIEVQSARPVFKMCWN
jgi:hypothetical protein